MAAVRYRNVHRVWQTGTYKIGTPNYITVSGTGADASAGYRTFDDELTEDSGSDTWADGDRMGLLLWVDELKYKIWTAAWDGTSSPHRLSLVEEEFSLGSWGDGDAIQAIAMPTKFTLQEQIARPTFADPVEVTSNTSVAAGWNGHIVEGNSGSPFTLTLPEGLPKMHCMIVQTGAGVVSIDPATNVTLNGATDTIALADQYKSAYLYHKGSDDWVILV